MTLDDDIRMNHELQVLKAETPKLARIRARQAIKVARAENRTDDVTIAKYVAAGFTVLVLSVSSCSAAVWGFDNDMNTDVQDGIVENQRYTACVENGGSWDNSVKDCDMGD